MQLAAPLQQSDSYVRALHHMGQKATRIALADGRAFCVLQERRSVLFGTIRMISRGPVGVDGSRAGDCVADLVRDGCLLINSPGVAFDSIGALEIVPSVQIGLLPLGGEATMRAAMHQKWRNRLNKAQRHGLKVNRERFDPGLHRWVIDAEQAQQKSRRYRNWPVRFLQAFSEANAGGAEVFVVRRSGTPVAAMLFLRHAPWATYHLGVTLPEGRQLCAHNLALWEAMRAYSERGDTMLDLGRLDGPPGLARFKRGAGANTHQLGGTWLYIPKAVRLARKLRQLPNIHFPFGQKA